MFIISEKLLTNLRVIHIHEILEIFPHWATS